MSPEAFPRTSTSSNADAVGPIAADEPARLAALHQYEVLDSDPEPAFDELAGLAARICGTPISLVTLVDADRQWFKARVGIDAEETPRDVAFCAHAILGSELLVVPDAAADPRFADNPLVTGEPWIRFYAGAPLLTDDGFALGTLCVIDRRPRRLTEVETEALRSLSRQAVRLLELRRAANELERAERRLEETDRERRSSERIWSRIVESSRDCVKLLDLDGRLLSMNAGGLEILEIRDLEPLLHTPWVDFWKDEHRQSAERAIEAAQRGDVGRFVGFCPSAAGRPMWWDVIVSPILDEAGRPERLLATSRDVTRQVRNDQTLRALASGTAEATGHEFFRSLARNAAAALHVRYAFVSRCVDEARTRARTLAFWGEDGFLDDVEFDVAPTPCRRVLEGEVVHVAADVQAQFPEDHGLVDLAAESYLGLPIRDAGGRVVGHLAVLDDRPFEADAVPHALDVLGIFAVRASAELERLQVEERRRALLEINNAVALNLTRESLFRSATEALKRIVPFDRAAIFAHDPESDVLRLYALETDVPSGFFAVGAELSTGDSHVGKAFRDRTPVLRRDLAVEATYEAERALDREGFRSLVIVPLVARGEAIGTLNLASLAPEQYSDADAGFLMEIAVQIALAVENLRAYEQLAALKDRLAAENVYLQEEIRSQHGFEEIVGESPALTQVLARVEQVAPTDATVLVLGETGTGKELVARAIHALSPRRERPLVVVNCGAISAGLVESELFGHEKGAFTGASSRKIGRFELADGGSIFLDEIGDLPADLQVKLLRALEEGEIERVGGATTIQVDVRVIAATNRDLETAVAEGRFRSDLFYRLNVFPVRIPPLRERREDIPTLIRYFVLQDGARLGHRIERVPRQAIEALVRYDWPGNVRELRNVIERSIITSPGDTLELGDWMPAPHGSGGAVSEPRTLEEMERDHILAALERTGWVVSGPRGAARLLGLKPTTLEARMKRRGIVRPRSSQSAGSVPNIA